MAIFIIGVFIGLMLGLFGSTLYSALHTAKQWNSDEYKNQLREDYAKAHPVTHTTPTDVYAMSEVTRCPSCGHEWKEHPFVYAKPRYCPSCGKPLEESTDGFTVKSVDESRSGFAVKQSVG